MLDDCFRKIAFDEEAGTIDYDRVATGITTSERNRFTAVRNILSDLEEKMGKQIPIVKIQEDAEKKGIDEDRMAETLKKLRRTGDIFETKKGFISRI